MINANLIRRVALFIVTGCMLAVSAASADAKTTSHTLTIPGLTFLTPYTTPNQTTCDFNHITTVIPAVITSNKSPRSILDLFVPVSPTPAIFPAQAAKSVKTTMVTQAIVEKTVDVTPTTAPSPTQIQPQPTQSAPSPSLELSTGGGLNADVLFGMVNSYRQAHNLPAFEKNDQVCALAVSRAPEISEEVANGHMHSGLRARNLPYWNTENIISMRSEVEAFNWWINDYIHKVAIESNYKYSCLACSGDSCAEEFTSLEPK